MIIRMIVILIEIIIAYLLQTSVFTYFALAGVVPDFIIILTVSVAFMRGRWAGMFTGFFCGLLLDFAYGDVIGIYALIIMSIGYLVGFANKIYDSDDYTLPYIFIGTGEFVYHMIYFVVFFLLQGKLNLGYYIYRFVIPEILYTVLISVLIYRLLNAQNQALKHFDRT